jgi:hypothetical protein
MENEDFDNIESGFTCPLCNNANADIRFTEAIDDIINVLIICKDCFTRSQPILEKNPMYISEIIEELKGKNLFGDEEGILINTDPLHIKELGPGVYRIPMELINEFYEKQRKFLEENSQNYVDFSENEQKLGELKRELQKRKDKIPQKKQVEDESVPAYGLKELFKKLGNEVNKKEANKKI